MRLPRQPYSWDEGDNRPVPPEHLEDPSEVRGEGPIASAEMVVREAQDAIAREDTDPAIPQAVRTTTDGRLEELRPRRIALVAAGCVLAFFHGWVTGSPPGPSGHTNSCGMDACDSVSTVDEGRTAQA